MAFLSGYSYRKKLTIDSGDIDSSLTDSPILVKLTESNFDFNKASVDGSDIKFTSNDGETLLKFEREFHGSIGTVYSSDFLTGGTASATLSDGGAASNAVDNNETTYWATSPSGLPQSWGYDLGVATTKTAEKLRLKPFRNANGGYVDGWELYGSNLSSPNLSSDGDWTLITSGNHADTDAWEEYTFSNSTAYRHYRLKVVSNHRPSFQDAAIYEIELMESLGETYEAYYWVKIPSVSSSTDTDIYIYYGAGTGYVDGADPTNVWDSDYKAVWHLSETGLDGTADEVNDSTSNDNDANAVGTAPVSVDGLIYNGLQGQGTNSELNAPDNDTLDIVGDFTLEWKMKWISSVANASIMGKSQGGGGNPKWILNYGGLVSGAMGFHDGASTVSWSWTPSADTFYHCVLTRSGNDFKFYVNGTQQGSTVTSALSVPNTTQAFHLFTDGEGFQWFSGVLDEVRVTKGLARTASYIKAQYESDRDDLLTFGTEEQDTTIDEQESIIVADDIAMQISTDLDSEDTIISDDIIVNLAKSQESTEELIISDEAEISVGVNIEEDVIISDEILVNIPVEYLDLNEEFIISDSSTVVTIVPTDFASQIISINPLIFVTDNDPVQVVKVDTTDPENPTWTIKVIDDTGISTKNAKDVAYNSITDTLYVATAEGKLLKIAFSDLDVLEEIDLGDTDDLIDVEISEDFQRILSATSQADGEVIVLDDLDIKTLTLDIRTLLEVKQGILINITTGFAKAVTTDIRTLSITKSFVSLDVRVINFNYADLTANVINRNDFDIKIDGVSVNDFKKDAITIQHMADQESEATFVLARKHDELNKMYDGTASEITAQNDVQIYIKGNLEFEGKISRIECQSESESVKVTAQAMTIKETNKKHVTLPMSLLNEKLHPFHVLLHNPTIYNPYIDPNNEENPPFYKGIKVDLGIITRQNVERWTIIGDNPVGGLFSQIILGQPSLGSTALDIMEGNFQPKQNWTYFWGPITAQNFSTGNLNTAFYVGTSLAGYSADTWELLQVRYKYQRIRDDWQNRAFDYPVASPGFISQSSLPEEELRELPIDAPQRLKLKTEYRIGEAPFQEISARNGQFIPKYRWEDREDGLYEVLDSKYDFRPYAIRIANLEYEKLKNINGDITPKTDATIETLLDGYYFNGISLLTRINIDNTTTASIYKNNNGFPVSIKSITISSANMRVSLACDNSFSLSELEEIDARYPDEENFIENPTETLLQLKFDPNRDEETE